MEHNLYFEKFTVIKDYFYFYYFILFHFIFASLVTVVFFPLDFQIKTRIDNEKYLRSHPEVEVLIGDFLRFASSFSSVVRSLTQISSNSSSLHEYNLFILKIRICLCL